jgi:hypothetical protein
VKGGDVPGKADTRPATARGWEERLRVLVLGYVVRGPLGGLAWHHLQYVLGLAELGHDVTFLEDSDDYESCYDPARDEVGNDPAYGLGFAAAAFGRLGLVDRWAYYDAHTGRWLGPAAGRVREACAGADLLLNVSGVNPLRPWLLDVPARVLVDTDPAFTQVRHLTDPAAAAAARRHTAFFSFGENIGRPGCTVPDDGLPWRPTRQPVALGAWPVTPGPADGPFTTVMQWDSYRAREYGGRRYGLKSDSFAPYLDLPRRSGANFELAVGSPTAPQQRLRENGWRVLDPRGPTRDPWAYQDYLRRSRAEFGVAKHGYVASRSGWFSERSAAYLASGRPVVVQDTGYTDWLRADAGVLAFGGPEEAREAVAEVGRAYARHCRAAREVAEAYFDARRVLPSLLERALAGPPAAAAAGGKA